MDIKIKIDLINDLKIKMFKNVENLNVKLDIEKLSDWDFIYKHQYLMKRFIIQKPRNVHFFK